MLSRLVEIIEGKAEHLGKVWTKQVLEHPLTTSYRRLSEEELRRRAENVYAALGHWLDHRISKDEAKQRYRDLGRRRCQEGFQIVELVVALSLEKRILMDVLREESFFLNALQMHSVFELMESINDFFDRALIYTIQGYETQRPHQSDDGEFRVHPTQTWFTVPKNKSNK